MMMMVEVKCLYCPWGVWEGKDKKIFGIVENFQKSCAGSVCCTVMKL